MRCLYLAFALLFATAFIGSAAVEAAPQRRTMRLKLANGKSMSFRLVMMHGRMMMMAPYNQFRDVFHGTSQ
jgi:hypothetical protein